MSMIMMEYKYYRVDLVNILPELYMEVNDPELPSSKGVLSSLFGGSHHSVVDREELCKFTIYFVCVCICVRVLSMNGKWHHTVNFHINNIKCHCK